MNRKIIAFGNYYHEFMKSLNDKERLKVHYVLSLLQTEDRLPVKFIKIIREGLYELRISWNGNIYRLFFIFDDGQIVVLFNGFHKKTQKTPISEINKALKIKEVQNLTLFMEKLEQKSEQSLMMMHGIFTLAKFYLKHVKRQR